MATLEQLHYYRKVIADAYKAGELEQGSSCGCAVGNMIQQHYQFDYDLYDWVDDEGSFLEGSNSWFYYLRHNQGYSKIIQSLPFDNWEILTIEQLFESGEDLEQGYTNVIEWFNEQIELHAD